MENWQKSIDHQIEEARRQGKFDHLPGKGKPLKINENPYEDPAMSAAYTLLKDNDFTLPWIAEGKEIDEALEKSRNDLSRSWAYFQRELADGRMIDWAKNEWNRAEQAFREQVLVINKKIQNYNVAIPNSRFEKIKINADREIEKICTHQ